MTDVSEELTASNRILMMEAVSFSEYQYLPTGATSQTTAIFIPIVVVRT
jgi:hypothetical protein